MMLTWNDYNESYFEPVDDYKKYPNGTARRRAVGINRLPGWMS